MTRTISAPPNDSREPPSVPVVFPNLADEERERGEVSEEEGRAEGDAAEEEGEKGPSSGTPGRERGEERVEEGEAPPPAAARCWRVGDRCRSVGVHVNDFECACERVHAYVSARIRLCMR